MGGQLWRTTLDIRDSWASMLSILDKQVGLEKYSGPNAWNDPDMLEVGNGRMTNAVDQDWGGKQGYKLKGDGATQVWIKPMSNGDRAVVLLNRSPATATILATMKEIGLAPGQHAARDVWAHADRTADGEVSAAVPSHSVAMFIVRR